MYVHTPLLSSPLLSLCPFHRLIETMTSKAATSTTETTSHEALLPSPSSQPQPQPQPTIHLILTAFGPFGGVPDNPTMTLLRELPQFLSSSSSSSSSSTSGWKALVQQRIVHTMVIETSAQGAHQAIHQIHDQILPNVMSSSSSSSSTSPTILLCLHLGVNASAQRGEFQLEGNAYNDATFRIPDEQGYRPNREPILSHVRWGTPLSTSLLSMPTTTTTTRLPSPATTTISPSPTPTTTTVLDDLIHHLSLAIPALNSRLSTDPGRFVCNYLYYLSLNQWQQDDGSITTNGTTTTTSSSNSAMTTRNKNDDAQNTTGTSLFLHIPPFEQVPKDIQLEYLAELMRILCQVELQ